MTDTTQDYIDRAKAARQRIIEAGKRYDRELAERQAAEAERARHRALRRLEADRTADMPPMDAALREKLIAVLVARNLTWRHIISHAKHGSLHPARQDIYAILRERGWSYPVIARFCNRSCHTSVMYALRNYAYRKEREANAK